MIVLNETNTYGFPNMTVQVTDNTVTIDDTITPEPDIPDFNVLIPTVQPVGVTNTLELYYPGEPGRYMINHGKPNAIKNGFGPDIIYEILSRPAANVGVYTINLRGPSARNANTLVVMKYKVEKDVPYKDTEGNPYYIQPNGKIDTTVTDKPVIRDVLHIKYTQSSNTDCTKWTDILSNLNDLRDDTVDADGYMTMPLFGVMYSGATEFGNNVFFKFNSKVQDFDGMTYYSCTCFDGVNTTTSDYVMSFDVNSGARYNSNYYIENQFNSYFSSLRYMGYEGIEDLYKVFEPFLYTLEDYIAGEGKHSLAFAGLDIFNCNQFAVVTDEPSGEGSVNPKAANAFQLANGTDGTETRDELFNSFFAGGIIDDITSVIRYRFNYVPDIGYDITTKQTIADFCKKRNRMTIFSPSLGGETSFDSAILERQTYFYGNDPTMRVISNAQSPMRFNQHVRRTIKHPAGYYDTIALMDSFARAGNFYMPYAGYDARWTDYIDDTMIYPPNNPDYLKGLYTNRVNVVMKDSSRGGYMSDQLMNTELTSDMTEFNNALLVSNMLYDLVWLVHRNHFKFNEASDVQNLNNAVDDFINPKYMPFAASMSTEVYRMGTVGRAASANKIKVTIDLKDINRFTDIEIILVDE